MNVAPFPTVAPELACVAGVRAALASGVDPAVSAEDARRAVAEWARVESQIAARKMALLRRIDDSTVVRDAGATSTGSLISADFGGDQTSAARQVRTAKNLKVATLTEQALEAGEITFEKAEVIARTIAGLPHGLRRRVLRVADLYASREQADLTRAKPSERARRGPGRTPDSGRPSPVMGW